MKPTQKYIETTGNPWERVYFSVKEFNTDYVSLFRACKTMPDGFGEIDDTLFADLMLEFYKKCLSTLMNLDSLEGVSKLKVHIANRPGQKKDIEIAIKLIIRHVAKRKALKSLGIESVWIEKKKGSQLSRVLKLQDEIYEKTLSDLTLSSKFDLINPYPNIFKDSKSWKLFEEYMQGAVRKHLLRECSFIYRMMCEKEKPALIHSNVRPRMFIEWYNENMTENLEPLSELKTYAYAHSLPRENNYKRIKSQLFNPIQQKK